MALTLTQIVVEALRRLGDTEETVWSAPAVKAAIREGYDELGYRTLYFWKRARLADVANQAEYPLPTDCYRLDRATWNAERLPALSNRELMALDAQYRTSKGRVEAYTVDGRQRLRKYRIPSVDGSGDLDTFIEYYRRGAALPVDDSPLEFPDHHTRLVRYFALSRLLELEGPGQDLELAEHYMGRFVEGVKRIRRTRIRFALRAARQFGGPWLRRPEPPGPVLGPEFPRARWP